MDLVTDVFLGGMVESYQLSSVAAGGRRKGGVCGGRFLMMVFMAGLFLGV